MQRKFVLDTNIYISAILSKKLESLTQSINTNNITVCICDELLEEISDVLARPKIKKYLTLPVFKYLYLIKDFTLSIPITHQYTAAPDPDDNYLYDLCLHSKAILVTGDKLLLNYKSTSKVKVITYQLFLTLVE